jgi:hypothetical protein
MARNRKTKHRNRSKRSTRSRRYRKKGGCGEDGIGGTNCGIFGAPNNTTMSDMYGQYGGLYGQPDSGSAVFPVNFANVPIRSFYGANDFNGDPNQYQVSVGNIPQANNQWYGGKKRSTRGKSRKRRVMRGGSGLVDAISNYTAATPDLIMTNGLSQNPINMIGNLSGVSSVANILTTNYTDNAASNQQTTLYGPKNLPLA